MPDNAKEGNEAISKERQQQGPLMWVPMDFCIGACCGTWVAEGLEQQMLSLAFDDSMKGADYIDLARDPTGYVSHYFVADEAILLQHTKGCACPRLCAQLPCSMLCIVCTREISLPCHPAVSCNARGISVRAVGRPMALSSGQRGSVVGLLLQLRTLFCVGSTYAQLLLRPVRLLPLAVCLCRPRPAGEPSC
jgi:hypothetical protein